MDEIRISSKQVKRILGLAITHCRKLDYVELVKRGKELRKLYSHPFLMEESEYIKYKLDKKGYTDRYFQKLNDFFSDLYQLDEKLYKWIMMSL